MSTRHALSIRPRLRPFDYDILPDGRSTFVSATFACLEDVRNAVRQLEREGCPAHEISVVVSDRSRRYRLRTHPEFEGLDADSYLLDGVELSLESKALKGAGAGGTVGGAIGGTLGAIAAGTGALGTTLVLPGLGLVIAGPLAAAIAGAGAGGSLGGLLGLLMGARRPEYRPSRLERILRSGHILLVTRARTTAERQKVAEALLRAGGVVEEPA